MSRPAFVPWSEQMSAHHMKPRPIDYHCCCVIHKFSSSRGGLSVLFSHPSTEAQSPISCPCNKWLKGGMIPPTCCLLLSKMRSLVAYMAGELINAETCDGVAAREN